MQHTLVIKRPVVIPGEKPPLSETTMKLHLLNLFLTIPFTVSENNQLRRKNARLGNISTNEVPPINATQEPSFVSDELNPKSFVETAPPSCVNNATFTFMENPKMSCRWIRWKEIRRTVLCKNADVRSNCPQTCGLCCEDDPTYNFRLPSFQSFNCASIASESDGAENVCNIFSNGRMIRDGCPFICNFCQVYVPLQVLPSSLPSQSSANSLEPTIDKMTPPENYDLIIERLYTGWSPTPSPTSVSSSLNRVSSLDMDCKDNDFYQNPLGGNCGCSLFEATDCAKWDIFLSDAEVSTLLMNCPQACGICRWVFDSFQFLYIIDGFLLTFCCYLLIHSNEPTQGPTTRLSSDADDDSSCEDDNEYVSPVNQKFGCNLYDGTDCSIWFAFLNSAQIQEMLDRCPKSCKRDCG